MAEKKTKKTGKCGFAALLALLITGGLSGSLGILVAHLLTSHAGTYYLILFPTFVLALILGIGLRIGTAIGRCSRINVFTFLLVMLCVFGSYFSLLFLNQFHESLEPAPSLADEAVFLLHDGWNLAAELPFVSDYVRPITVPEVRKLFADSPVDSDDGQEASAQTRPHLASRVTAFFRDLPDQAFSQEKPVTIGTIFNLAVFVPIEGILSREGITRWEQEDSSWEKRLVFDERAVQPWMLWTVELLLLWLIVFLMTYKGTKNAFRRLEKRRRKHEQPGLDLGGRVTPGPAAYKIVPELDSDSESENETQKTAKTLKVKKEKGDGFFGFGRKKRRDEPETEPPDVVLFPEGDDVDHNDSPSRDQEEAEMKSLALILHHYAPERQEDLVRLMQQVGEVSEARARRLLKVPSLIARDITPQQANIAIEKFNQVQAQVKLITMEHLEQLQNKQRQSAQSPASKALSQRTAPSAAAAPDTRYALILRKFDPVRRKDVLELLSGLSGTPLVQLQQSLKTPALVLRDASKDEAAMIVQQFKTIQAEVKMLTMLELQKLMARK
ncbi:hypothetical protein CSB45_11755 [candidate division KSB3 bacterium]|uniref:Uncharacterized protein n=1 Tax=candidate division KSB3 bacterium TaxID=2044937 RepID=A0A2G6E3N2_9BACT|nr:MAG: hypothetical protein CSB45_11755 [candidate division KSB3 bacterium]PIE29270.1 MAG: hypothetical protein CSA57_09695 [candidate division KSB3 bacterium]